MAGKPLRHKGEQNRFWMGGKDIKQERNVSDDSEKGRKLYLLMLKLAEH